MFIYIAGAGAMGCRFGYQLQKSGNEVVLLDNWQAHIDAIKANGLHVTGEEDLFVPMTIMHPTEATKQADLIILFTKAMQLEAMLKDIKGVIGAHTKVLCLLNGLGHEDVIKKFVAKENIMMGVTVWTAGLKEPGVVFLQGKGTINLQSFSNEGEAAVKEIVDTMNAANLNVIYDNDVVPSIWRKACVNGTMNSTCALTDAKIGQFFGSEAAIRIVKTIIHEFVLVGTAEGVKLNEQEIVDYVMHTAEIAAHHYPSMHQDLMQNHRLTEIDYINGAVARKGEKLGIATPYCKMITDLIHAKESILEIK